MTVDLPDLQPLVTRLTSRWIEALPDEPASTAVSGLGAWPLLAILATAADGAGRDELAGAVGLDPESSAAAGTALISRLAESDNLSAAFGFWAQRSVPLVDGVVPPAMRGVLTGDDEQDRKVLDDWVRKHTHGLIDAMPVDTGPDLLMALATALAIRTRWRLPFNEAGRNLKFDGRQRRSVWLGRSEPDLDAVRRHDLPAGPLTTVTVAGTGDVDVVVVIGADGRRRGEVLADALRALGSDGRGGSELIQAEPSTDEVSPAVTVRRTRDAELTATISLPAFELTVTHDLLDHAEVFGLGAAGSFPGLSPQPLAITQARQTLLARFFAEGFEAAALTAIGVGAANLPPPDQSSKALDVDIDRPFGFVAVHRPSRLPIIAGWVDSDALITPEPLARPEPRVRPESR